jgi:hypothetical protein
MTQKMHIKFVRKCDCNSQLGISGRRWKYNIKMDLKVIGWGGGYELDASGSG